MHMSKPPIYPSVIKYRERLYIKHCKISLLTCKEPYLSDHVDIVFENCVISELSICGDIKITFRDTIIFTLVLNINAWDFLGDCYVGYFRGYARGVIPCRFRPVYHTIGDPPHIMAISPIHRGGNMRILHCARRQFVLSAAGQWVLRKRGRYRLERVRYQLKHSTSPYRKIICEDEYHA